MPLGADHARQLPVEQGQDGLGHEGPARAIDMRDNAVFLGFGGVIGKAIKLLGPHRMLVGAFEVEQSRPDHISKRHIGEIGLEDAGIGIEAADDLARRIDPLWRPPC
jgi:hypothetical protein